MEKSKVAISCIIPMYNAADYIERCLDSILSQSFNDYEVIIVDDGSTDSSLSIVQKYLSDRIRVVVKSNGGVSSARNYGINCSKGDYIFFLDADDYLPADAFSSLYNCILQYDAQLVIGRDLCVSNGKLEHNNYSNNILVLDDEDLLQITLKDYPNTWNVCGKLFCRNYFESIHFVEGRNYGEDSFFFFECALLNPRSVFIEKCVYYVNISPNSSTRSPISKKKIDDILYFVNRKMEAISVYCPKYISIMKNLEIKANLVIINMLIKSNTTEYEQVEKQALNTIIRNKKYYIWGQTNDRLFAIVILHLYKLYKSFFKMRNRISRGI